MNLVKSKCLIGITAVTVYLFVSGCSFGGCSKYASRYSCSYVENDAEYEVWYWRNFERDDEDDEKLIGRAIGLTMCENNARAFAEATGQEFNYRAYICVLMKDDMRMEKHRLLES